MDEQKIIEMMKLLDLTREEAIDLINEDKEIDRMTVKEAENDLTAEQKKAIKKIKSSFCRLTVNILPFFSVCRMLIRPKLCKRSF